MGLMVDYGSSAMLRTTSSMADRGIGAARPGAIVSYKADFCCFLGGNGGSGRKQSQMGSGGRPETGGWRELACRAVHARRNTHHEIREPALSSFVQNKPNFSEGDRTVNGWGGEGYADVSGNGRAKQSQFGQGRSRPQSQISDFKCDRREPSPPIRANANSPVLVWGFASFSAAVAETGKTILPAKRYSAVKR